MRSFAFIAFFGAVLLTASCATTSKYDAKVSTWKGKDQATLMRAWGQPDSTEKLSGGNKILVYSRLKHTPVAYLGAQRAIASIESGDQTPAYIKCATYFEVDPSGTIVSTLFRGDECKSKD